MSEMEEPYLPKEVNQVQMVFGGIEGLTIPYEAIPSEFKSGQNKWCKFQATWFFRGIKGLEVEPREGIDHVKALRHLAAIQGSYALKHEHKSALVAYFASIWFSDVKFEGE